jgi:hypothetical protein
LNEQNKTITIDGRPYELDALSENARSQVINLQVVDEEIRRAEARLAMFKTARAAYARVLKSELDKTDSLQ